MTLASTLPFKTLSTWKDAHAACFSTVLTSLTSKTRPFTITVACSAKSHILRGPGIGRDVAPRADDAFAATLSDAGGGTGLTMAEWVPWSMNILAVS